MVQKSINWLEFQFFKAQNSKNVKKTSYTKKIEKRIREGFQEDWAHSLHQIRAVNGPKKLKFARSSVLQGLKNVKITSNTKNEKICCVQERKLAFCEVSPLLHQYWRRKTPKTSKNASKTV